MTSNPVSLPTWEECKARVDAETATPLEAFIYENEPALTEKAQDFVRKCIPNYGRRADEQFRGMLAALIAFVRTPDETSDVQHLMAALVQQEYVLTECETLLREVLDEHGVNVGFDERLQAYWTKSNGLSDWRSRDLRLVEESRETSDRRIAALRWLAESADPNKLTGLFVVTHARRALGMQPEEPKALTPSQIGRAIADNCELAPLPHPPGCECRLCLPVKATGPRLGDPHPPSCACWECNK